MGCCMGRSLDSSVPESEEELPIAVGKNKQLIRHRLKWRSDIQITEGQLAGKRDEFWHTAPAFEGRREIWDALRAATSCAENGDYVMAQAILDGANISLPDGTIRESYDELGCRYQIPIYCLSKPLNLLEEETSRRSSSDAASVSAGHGGSSKKPAGPSLTIKLRLSTTSQELKMEVRTTETVKSAKQRLHSTLESAVPSYHHQRWYFGGRLLGDRVKIQDCRIPANCVVQVVLPYVSPSSVTTALEDDGQTANNSTDVGVVSSSKVAGAPHERPTTSKTDVTHVSASTDVLSPPSAGTAAAADDEDDGSIRVVDTATTAVRGGVDGGDSEEIEMVNMSLTTTTPTPPATVVKPKSSSAQSTTAAAATKKKRSKRCAVRQQSGSLDGGETTTHSGGGAVVAPKTTSVKKQSE